MILQEIVNSVSLRDKQFLATCALVSREWLEEARRHLCASVHIDTHKALLEFTRQLDESPMYMRALVKELVVWEYLSSRGSNSPSWALTDVPAQLAGRLPNVERIAFRTNSTFPVFYRVPLDLEPRFANVRSLSLSHWAFHTFTDFSQFLSVFPSLSTLRCTQVRWVQDEVTAVPALGLSDVTLSECGSESPIMRLWGSRSRDIQDPHFEPDEVNDLVALVGATILKLKSSSIQTIRFSKQYDKSDRCWRIICKLESQLPTLTITCSLSSDSILHLDRLHFVFHSQHHSRFDWTTIDNILAKLPAFQAMYLVKTSSSSSSWSAVSNLSVPENYSSTESMLQNMPLTGSKVHFYTVS